MTFKLSKRSLKALEGVNPELVAVVQRAIQITSVDFVVTEGLRTPERQKVLFDSGASQTLNSKHLTGDAVDLAAWVDNKVDWSWPLYSKLAAAMKAAAKELDVSITWGGDWKHFKDGPHFEIARKIY